MQRPRSSQTGLCVPGVIRPRSEFPLITRASSLCPVADTQYPIADTQHLLMTGAWRTRLDYGCAEVLQCSYMAQYDASSSTSSQCKLPKASRVRTPAPSDGARARRRDESPWWLMLSAVSQLVEQRMVQVGTTMSAAARRSRGTPMVPSYHLKKYIPTFHQIFR